MKFNSIFFALLFLVIAYSCAKREDYSATSSSFADYKSWHLQSTKTGSAFLSGAHQGFVSGITRKIYFKDAQSRSNGVYPIGTIIVKEATDSTGKVVEVTAMVKRGTDFNTSAGNWEWFMLTNDGSGTIAVDASENEMRGGVEMMAGMCNNCHRKALTNDFTFSK